MPYVYLRNGQIFREVQIPELQRYYRTVIVFGLLLFAIYTTPSEESFRAYLKSQSTWFGQKWWIQFFRIALDKYSYANYIVLSVATYESKSYIGYINAWYEVPSSYHEPLDDIDAVRFIWVLTFIVHTAWTQAPFFLFMAKHFSGSMFNVIQGRLWCIPLSCFSHKTVAHFISNTLSYWVVAPYLQAILGKMDFVRLYLLGGSFAVSFSLLYRVHKIRQASLIDHVNGVNGAIYAMYGCLLAWIWDQKVNIVAFEWSGLEVTFLQLTIGHALTDFFSPYFDFPSHISGLLFGLIFYYTVQK